MGKIKQKLSKIFLIDPAEPFFSEKSRKVFLIASFSYVGLISLLIFAAIGLVNENYFYSSILSIFAVSSIVFIIFFSLNTSKYEISGYALTFIMLILAISLLFLLDEPQNAILWQYVLVPMAFFLVGKKSAALISLILLAVTIVFYFLHPNDSFIDLVFFVRYVFTFTILMFFVYLYEFVRQRTLKSLVESKGKVAELLAESQQQHEEIKTQHEEIRAQSEQLVFVNNQLEKLSYVAKHTDNAVIILDRNGVFEWVNDGFEKMFGRKHMEIPAEERTIQKLSKKANINEILAKCAISKISASYESTQIHVDGHEITLNSTVTPIFDSDGDLEKFIIVDSDISLIKRTQKKLEELNKTLKSKVEEEVKKNREKDLLLIQQSRQAAMGEMISNIAHQWRQPLNAIGIIVQNLLEAYQYGEIDEKYLIQKIDKVMSLITYMSETIDDFRNFFKPERKAQKFFVRETVEKAIKFVEANFKGLNINLDFKSKNDPVAFGYPNEYMQVVINILNNAREALMESKPESPQVKIILEAIDNESFLRIFNNGGNIKPEVGDKVFDPYFSTKHISRGTGLGLYMGKNIIENNMSGKLYFENKPDGVEFIIQLPDVDMFD
ncbi:MAG: PAS domain S-box protein [Bacteroidetes bacterium]|nr:PAS domain S-box protein [Bacteroidota bacterium]